MSKYPTPGALLESESDLVSLPDIVVLLQEAIADPHSTAESIASIISRDPALTARLLRLANSPIYGFGGRIDTVSRAVTLVGVEPIYHLALSTCALHSFRNIPVQLIDMDEFWVQSVYSGVVARLLAVKANVLHPDRLFVAGLLHGIGSLLIYCKCPDQAREILLASQGKRELVPLLENDLLGFSYADVGAEIARRWNMPPWLVVSIANHIDPEAASSFQLETSLLHLADRLTSVLVFGEAVEDILAEIPPSVLELTRLNEGQILQVMTAVYYEFTEVADVLLSV